MGLSIIAKKAAKKKAAKMATEKKAKQNEISRIQNKKQISESELRRVSSLRKQIKSLDEKIKKGKLSAASVPKSPKVIRNAEAGGPSYPKKKSSTPTQRAFGGGKRRGLSTGRKQGAAAGAAVGLSVSAIMAIRSRKRLEELKQKNLDANQRAAVNKALRQVAEKEAAKAKMGGTKPKPRPKK